MFEHEAIPTLEGERERDLRIRRSAESTGLRFVGESKRCGLSLSRGDDQVTSIMSRQPRPYRKRMQDLRQVPSSVWCDHCISIDLQCPQAIVKTKPKKEGLRFFRNRERRSVSSATMTQE